MHLTITHIDATNLVCNEIYYTRVTFYLRDKHGPFNILARKKKFYTRKVWYIFLESESERENIEMGESIQEWKNFQKDF